MEEEILKTRWKDVDKLLAKYSKDYKKLNKKTQDKLQDVFNLIKVPYQDLNKPISKQEKARLDRFILELQESGLLSDYFGYRARLILNKKKVTYSEMLRIMIEGCYIQENKELDEVNNLLYYEIADNAYQQGIREAGILKPIHLHIPFETMYLLLNIPLLEATAEVYLMALELDHAEEIYKRALMILQQGRELNINSRELQELIKKQQRSIINIREEGQPTGAMSNITDNLVNDAYLQVAKDNNIQKVRFIAEMDERTTRMCKNMNGMIFNVQAENKFKRYFGYDAKHLYYKTITCYGLVKGLNMPPIDNHFHWCRSTLSYNLELTAEDTQKYIYKKIPVVKTVNGVDYLGGYVDRYGVYHPIPGYEKITIPNDEYNKEEILLAEWLKREKGGDVQLVPTIDTEEGTSKRPNIKTPDILWNGERWDFKRIDKNRENTIKRKFNDYKEQTDNLIIYPNTNINEVSDEEILKYIEKYFKQYSNDYDSVIYVRDYKIVKEFKK